MPRMGPVAGQRPGGTRGRDVRPVDGKRTDLPLWPCRGCPCQRRLAINSDRHRIDQCHGKKAVAEQASTVITLFESFPNDKRAALMQKIPYYTTIAGAEAAANAIAALKAGNLEVRPLQDYFAA